MNTPLSILLLSCLASWITVPDSCLQTDSYAMCITPSDEYHVFDVLRADTACSRAFLWGITENDSLLYSVFSRPELDSCSWKIFHYHQGCMMHTDSTYRLHIGNYDTLYSPFSHKEFTYIPGVMSPLDVRIYQTCLALKYGITLDDVPYIGCQGDTLWDNDEDALFYHCVTGIGHDTLHHWYATETSSTEGSELTICCDTLFPGEYIIAGDNGATALWNNTSEGYCVYSKEWRIRTRFKPNNRLRSLRLSGTLPSSVTAEDSLIVSVYGKNGNLLHRSYTDSIVSDTLFCVSFVTEESQLTLRFELPFCESFRQRKVGRNTQGNSQLTEAEYNAATGYLYLPDPIDCRYRYCLYDSSGKQLRCFESRDNLLDIGILAPGVYLIEGRSLVCENCVYRFVSP